MSEAKHKSGNSEIQGFRDASVPQSPDSPIPYRNLYIYYIQGRVKPCNEISGREFVGNWEEDDFFLSLFFRTLPGENGETSERPAEPDSSGSVLHDL